MRIQHNIMAMNAYRNYNKNTSALSKNLEKLSSGYKINRAGDDAAGLAISEKMRAQITGLEAAQKNVKDGISLVNTSEGAMQEIQDMLNRMVYLATESANGTYDNEVDRKNLQQEVDQLRSEINRIADSANFNGIKLLDGSLDAEGTTTISAESAISNIQTSEYSANGSSPAFEATYVTNRPQAATYQTNAKFSVSLDDLGFTGTVAAGDTFELKIGDATINYTVQAGAVPANATALAAALAKCGYKIDTTAATAVKEFAGGPTANPNATSLDTTSKWNASKPASGADVKGASAAAKYIDIEGHWYKMDVNGKEITFEQVDYMGTSGSTIEVDFDVSASYTQTAANKTANGENKMTGTVNDHVQKPVTGVGIGASHQAQVDLAIDFAKLKDGDKLTVGDKTYVFKVGKDGAGAAGTGESLIDLSRILTEEADLQDAKKLNKAIALITYAIDGSTTAADLTEADKGNTTAVANSAWSSGNIGINGTVGTISFQSKSSYTDDTKVIGTGAVVNASTPDIDKINMTTEANIMRQFTSERAANNASVSMDIDVTKIKQGDQITINGVKFEFWSEGNMKDDTATKIDLSSLGDIKDGKLLAGQTTDVMNQIKTTVQAALGAANYTVSTDNNTLKIESLDNSATGVKENKIAAKVELDQNAYAGRALTLQIGDTSDDFNQLAVSVKDMHTASLGIDAINIGTAEGAKAAINVIKDAINSVSEVRGKLGAISNRLDHTANNLSVMRENIQDAESSIRDTDVAEEMMSYTKNNIFSLRRKNKINKRVKKPVFMRICGGMAPGCEECLAA